MQVAASLTPLAFVVAVQAKPASRSQAEGRTQAWSATRH